MMLGSYVVACADSQALERGVVGQQHLDGHP
jgi:hypothetical protein